MKKQLYVLVALVMAATMILTACGPDATTAAPATAAPATAAPATVAAPAGKVLIRWTIGLGTGSDPAQVPIENAVVAEGLTAVLININIAFKIKNAGIRITGVPNN